LKAEKVGNSKLPEQKLLRQIKICSKLCFSAVKAMCILPTAISLHSFPKAKPFRINFRKPHTHFVFFKERFADETKTITVEQEQQIEITLKQGTTSRKFSLPGIVQIKSEPSGGEILMNGQKVGVTPYQGELASGNHQLKVRKPLYHSDVSTFTIEEGKTKSLSVKLKPRFGFLTVSSSQTNATVTLDEKQIGNAPISRKEIESAQHTLLVEKDLYHSYTETFSIQDGEEKNISAVLKPAFGTLSVTSLPESKAEVFLDGKKVGETPFTNNQLPSGKYILKLSKNLYSDTEEEILIEDGTITTKTITLNKNFGELSVTAEYSTIYLNGKEVGKEQYTARLSPGRYTLRAERGTQYAPDEKDITLSIGEEKNSTLTPSPRLGSVSVFVEPAEASDAEIYVDNVAKGNAPLVLPLLIYDSKRMLCFSFQNIFEVTNMQCSYPMCII